MRTRTRPGARRSGQSRSGRAGWKHQERSVAVLLDLNGDFLVRRQGAHLRAEGPEPIRGLEQAVYLLSRHDLVDQALWRAHLQLRQSSKDVVDTCFQIEDALPVALEAANEVLKLVVRVALAGLDALQDDHTALERYGECREFEVGAEHATVLGHTGESGLHLRDLDAVPDERAECRVPFLHAAVRVLDRSADRMNG